MSETACRDCCEADPLCPFIVISALYMNQLNSVLLFTKHATTATTTNRQLRQLSCQSGLLILFCSDDGGEVRGGEADIFCNVTEG